jgi:YVTN family beta-propeller protein
VRVANRLTRALSGRPDATALLWASPAAAVLLAATALAVGDGGAPPGDRPPAPAATTASPPSGPRPAEERPAARRQRSDVYAHTRAGMLSPAVAGHRQRVYVPNSDADSVSVIDPRRMEVVDTFPVGGLPHHVTPSHDLRTLYVNNTQGNSLTPIDPRTGRPKGGPVPVDDPYNLYFTPDGRSAIVVAERLRRLDFRDPRTWRMQRSVAAGCAGVDHMDFTASGRRAVASCEFDGTLLLVDVRRRKVLRRLRLDRPGSKPVDVRLSPDGRFFYVADEVANGVWRIDAERFRIRGFMKTGRGTHGLYPSRDAKVMYATNRLAGTVSVIDLARWRVKRTWRIPGGSPDMGGVSADGRRLWLSGRHHAEVYVLDTADGRLIKRIPVGAGAHGMLVWPQPGRVSLGHTGNMR